MKKISKRKIIDISLYVLICVWAVISMITMTSSNQVIKLPHYLGLVFLVVNGLIFYKHHHLGTIFLGFVLLLGFIGILSFNVGIITSSAYWIPFGLKIPIFGGNPIVFVLLVLHFILSGRYYVGIVTESYWKELLKGNRKK